LRLPLVLGATARSSWYWYMTCEESGGTRLLPLSDGTLSAQEVILGYMRSVECGSVLTGKVKELPRLPRRAGVDRVGGGSGRDPPGGGVRWGTWCWCGMPGRARRGAGPLGTAVVQQAQGRDNLRRHAGHPASAFLWRKLPGTKAAAEEQYRCRGLAFLALSCHRDGVRNPSPRHPNKKNR